MFSFLWNVITFLPWLITKIVIFVWSISTYVIGFIFTVITWPFKAVLSLFLSVLLFVLPGAATATNPPSQTTSSIATPVVVTSYNSEQKIQEIVSSIKDLQFEGSMMNRNNMVSCGNEMRMNQSKADRLREQVNKIEGTQTKMLVNSAIGELQQCVSCLPNAPQACDRANYYLNKLKN